MDQFIRTQMLLKEENMKKFKNSCVAVFGIGGVGSYVVEGLARCGIGSFILVDKDIIELSNINRQIIATHKTLGKPKVEVARDRIFDINPNANVIVHKIFYSKNTGIDILTNCNYVVDAIDTVSSKLDLIEECEKLKIPLISSMGTGNKLDPTQFIVTDIYKTSVCPLCRVLRHELKKKNIKKLKVVFSKEDPIKPLDLDVNSKTTRRQTPGSISFVPSVAGLIIASEVIKDLIIK
ncbi:MAG: tRNA threonylcarbamoyladenosine dehydratase [Eubacteriales bacterium SKADARSKE-1]|nr:tRNA threonylcarbamoyladenosine dehydratase [Eubacteriales bacterium SKADARSKE-1]